MKPKLSKATGLRHSKKLIELAFQVALEPPMELRGAMANVPQGVILKLRAEIAALGYDFDKMHANYRKGKTDEQAEREQKA